MKRTARKFACTLVLIMLACSLFIPEIAIGANELTAQDASGSVYVNDVAPKASNKANDMDTSLISIASTTAKSFSQCTNIPRSGTFCVMKYPGDMLDNEFELCPSNGEIKSMSSSDSSILDIQNRGDVVYITLLKPGTTKVSYKWNGKVYTFTLIVYKYKNPFRSFTIGSKNYTAKFKSRTSYTASSASLKGKVRIKLKSGWRLKSISAIGIFGGVRCQKKLKNGTKLKSKNKVSYFHIDIENSNTKQTMGMYTETKASNSSEEERFAPTQLVNSFPTSGTRTVIFHRQSDFQEVDSSYYNTHFFTPKNSKGKYTSVKSGNEDMLQAYSSSSSTELLIKKPGTTTVYYKLNGKSYSFKVKAVTWQNPVKSFKIGSRNFANKFAKNGEQGGVLLKRLKGAVKITPASGWRVLRIVAHGELGSVDAKKIRNGAKLLAKQNVSSVDAVLYNASTGAVETVSVFASV